MAIKPNNPMAPQPMNPSLNRPVTGGLRGPLRTGDSGSSSTNSGAGGGSSTTTPDVVSSTTAGTNPATFLYDVGLQNIYQDYQKSVANLNQQEQESLQDAYYIREMSKKYLGEYASNTGIGDVSGNLLDIYGAYQQNVAGIRSEFNTEERSLQQTYESTRRELETGKLLTEQQAAGNAPLGFTDLTSPQLMDTSDNLVDNPNYIPGLDISYFGLAGFDSTKQGIYINESGVEFISVALSSDEEQEAYDADKKKGYANSPDYETLVEFYKAQPQNKGRLPVEGDILPYENGATYVLKDGAWRRLQINTNSISATVKNWRENESTWNTTMEGNDKTTDKNKIITSTNSRVYFNVGSTSWTNASGSNNKSNAENFDVNTTDNGNKAILDEFKRLGNLVIPVGETTPSLMKASVVEYNGKLYYMNTEGKVWVLNKR